MSVGGVGPSHFFLDFRLNSLKNIHRVARLHMRLVIVKLSVEGSFCVQVFSKLNHVRGEEVGRLALRRA